LALNQNGGLFVVEFRFSENPYRVTQDGEAVGKEKNSRLVWLILPNHIPEYLKIIKIIGSVAQF
jgi:hypothetical protein